MTTIRITHSSEDGTVLEGDPRPHQDALKRNGFRWSRNVGWYIRGSRDHKPQTWRINAAAQALRDVGFDVEVEIDDSLRPMAEREAARTERIDGRQDALDAKADRKAAEAEALSERAHEMASIIPFGQPILRGHHSEKRDRNYRDKIHRTMVRGIETHREAEHVANKADASRSNQSHRESGPATKRRIEKLQAELRKVERNLAGEPCILSGKRTKAELVGETRPCSMCGTEVTLTDTIPEHYSKYHAPASGEYRERMLNRQIELNDEITYWQEHLEAIGFVMLGKDDFKKGDPIIVRGVVCTVVRANPKTVSVTSQFHSWPIKYGYEDVAKPTTT